MQQQKKQGSGHEQRCSPWSGYRKRGALRVGRKVGDNMWEWAGQCVCVCFMYLYCLSSSCVLCTQCYQSIHSHQKFQLAYQKKNNVLLTRSIYVLVIDDQHFSKLFLFFPLIFETSSVCGPFLICTSVFSQAPGSRIFFLSK